MSFKFSKTEKNFCMISFIGICKTISLQTLETTSIITIITQAIYFDQTEFV